MASLVNSTKHLKKKTVQILCKFFQKIEEDETFPNLIGEVSINFI